MRLSFVGKVFALIRKMIRQLQKYANFEIFSVTKGQVHEGIIRITDKGSVVTWDFDVMRHDVVFTVYRLKHPLKNKSPSSTPSPTPTGLATFNYPKKRDSKDNSDTSDNKATVAIAAKEQSTGQQSSNRY